jgi:hypothetical protein
MGQNPIPLVNIKIAGKWMFIPLKMVLIGIDPYPFKHRTIMKNSHVFPQGFVRQVATGHWGCGALIW